MPAGPVMIETILLPQTVIERNPMITWTLDHNWVPTDQFLQCSEAFVRIQNGGPSPEQLKTKLLAQVVWHSVGYLSTACLLLSEIDRANDRWTAYAYVVCILLPNQTFCYCPRSMTLLHPYDKAQMVDL